MRIFKGLPIIRGSLKNFETVYEDSLCTITAVYGNFLSTTRAAYKYILRINRAIIRGLYSRIFKRLF